MSTKKPTPQTPAQAVQKELGTPSTQKNRGHDTSLTGDSKPFSVGLTDIDTSIAYYFNNVIRPSVVQNGSKINVPIIYGSPERWKSVQADGYYRDKEGKIQVPLIMFRRTGLEKNRSLTNKLDGNNASNVQLFEKSYSRKNIYDRFARLNNRKPVKEYAVVVMPDYVRVQYECIIWTDYVEQMNKIVEGINFAADSYWGDPSKFQFRSKIDSFATSVELNTGQDRSVKTTFSLEMNGYIIPETINQSIAHSKKAYSTAQVSFGLEVERRVDEL